VDTKVGLSVATEAESALTALGFLLQRHFDKIDEDESYLLILDKETAVSHSSILSAINDISKDGFNFDIIAFPILDGDLSGVSNPLMSSPIGNADGNYVWVETASLKAILISKKAVLKLMSAFNNKASHIFGEGTTLNVNDSFFNAVKMAELKIGMKVNTETSTSYRRTFGYGLAPDQ
jgi:hypothetical protein